MAITCYPTKPIESWRRAEELRRQYAREFWSDHENKQVKILGIYQSLPSLASGFGNYATHSVGSRFTYFMRNPDELSKLLDGLEESGYPHDMCSTARCHLAQVLGGISTDHGKLKLDFVFQPHGCRSLTKVSQHAGEILGLPFRALDIPCIDTPGNRRYLVHQLNDAIEWMEKVTGRKYDDEKLIEATENEWESMKLWCLVGDLNKHKPAPLTMFQQWVLRLPLVLIRTRKECIEYMRMLLDEVRDRVAGGISGAGFEERRLTLEGIPPLWWTRGLYRLPQRYGAVFVANDMCLQSFGCWQQLTDGTWAVGKTPRERGIVMRTREDALEQIAELYVGKAYAPVTNSLYLAETRAPAAAKRVLDFHADGAVFHIDRGCFGENTNMFDRQKAVQKLGVPTLTFESSNADPRDCSTREVTSRFDAFLESMGLSRIA